MINGSSFVKKSKKAINDELRRDFVLASSDETFKKLCNRLKCDDEILMKYTSKLTDSACELKNCSRCKGLSYCKNAVKGHVYFPTVTKDFIEFSYKSCKYFKEKKKNNTIFFETPKMLMNASLSELITEKERANILKYIKDFLKKKVNGETVKGLYLSGSFGSGKSYILSALLNELSLKGYKCVNINYPLLLNKLKASFSDYNYNDVMEEIMTCDVLLIDDIGAENNSPWSRDEVLGTILQYRMDSDLTTFFTSNFTINELETELSETNKGTDLIKARRIIERIKYLTVEDKLISKDKR
ncbi:primosomal protein DnaI [Clostridium sp. CAG:524]|jgi:primosomal protein DnaI|nr:ATP-binding protein [Clostridium sp.]CDA60631.1 primosomal protein DnaI [Clostridium sp. CAG:524]